jgi:hypothetical protein
MDDIRLICDGLIIGSLVLPPFELRAGQLVTLQLPAPHDAADEQSLRSALSGTVVHAEVHVRCRVISADAAVPPRGPFAALRTSAVDWLARHGRISRPDAERVIRQTRICEPTDRVSNLAMTPRTTLGVLAAWATGAEAIIYSTSGLDPLGARAVQQLVRDRLQTCPALHLAHERVSCDQSDFDCPSGALVVRAERAEHLAGTAGARKGE